ncbi:MAG: hypothetical protein IJU07_08060 [Synergistaceae bacterium]|nr:hypothetical protein [Synergistaceae bacterium]
MRIFRGLENIHSVIDRHEAEWRKEQGEEPKHDTITLEEAVRRRLTAPSDEGSGRFSADRFLGGRTEPLTPKPKPEPIAETENDTEIPQHSEPESIEIIKSKDGRHSWLYNEVMKAINDASKDSKNTKIIAVFIPVIQNGKEFESLPVDETVTVQPIDFENTKVEAADDEVNADENEPLIAAETESAFAAASELVPEIETAPVPAAVIETEIEPEPETQPEVTDDEFHLIPEVNVESDKGLTEAFREIEEKLDGSIQETHEQEFLPEPEPETEEPATEILEPEPAVSEEDVSEEETLQEEIEPEHVTAMPLTGNEPEIETEYEPEHEQALDVPDVTEVTDENEDNYEINEEIAKGEPLAFEEINNSDNPETVQHDTQDLQNETGTDKENGESDVDEISLPEPLDDDDVFDEGIFDESLTEVYRPDDDEDGAVIIEDNGENESDNEIEIVPDPDKLNKKTD